MLLSRGGKFLTCPGVTCGCCVLQLDAVGLLGHLSQAVGGAVDMGVAPLFAGPYKLLFSLWGFTWNKGRIEPAPSLQYATVWPTPDISNTLSKSVGVMTLRCALLTVRKRGRSSFPTPDEKGSHASPTREPGNP